VQIQNTEILGFAQNDLGADARRTAKLASGAHEFEAMMLQQMMKGLDFGQAPGDGADGEEASGASGTLQSYGTEALAKAISGQGGFGIARKIIQQVTAEDAAKGNSPAGGKVR
jgi:Rod binding domain-containing protein